MGAMFGIRAGKDMSVISDVPITWSQKLSCVRWVSHIDVKFLITASLAAPVTTDRSEVKPLTPRNELYFVSFLT